MKNNDALRTRHEIQGEINAYKIALSQTDYKALKHADGVLSDAEYADTKAQRNEWRAKINDLEEEMEGLDE